MALGDAVVRSRTRSRFGVAGVLFLVAGCATTTPAVENYPVYRLAALSSEQSAWDAAKTQDQPVLILGSGIYGLDTRCIPVRYYAEGDDKRLAGSLSDSRLAGAAAEGRLTGSAGDGRLGGSGTDGRLGGATGDGRLGGAANDARLGGAATDGRLGGATADTRMYGSSQQSRSFGADEVGRKFGASESVLRCRLLADGVSIQIFGPASDMNGYLYSARLGGRMESVFFTATSSSSTTPESAAGLR